MALMTGHSKISRNIDDTVANTTCEWILQKSDVISESKQAIFESNDFLLTNREQIKCSTSLHVDAIIVDGFCDVRNSLLNVTINASNSDVVTLLIRVKINHALDEFKSFKSESQTINISGAESTKILHLEFCLPGQYQSSKQTTCLTSLIENNTLTIIIEILDVKELSKLNQFFEYKMKLTTEMFATLYKNHELFDVTFLVGENNCEIKAHALVLAAASPYFSAMFNNNMKEKKEHIVDLTKDPDINEEILQAFLDYVYGIKSVNELKNVASELFVLADKYNMIELLKSCEQLLCENLDEADTAKLLKLYLIACKHECNLLIKKAGSVDKAKQSQYKELDKLVSSFLNHI